MYLVLYSASIKLDQLACRVCRTLGEARYHHPVRSNVPPGRPTRSSVFYPPSISLEQFGCTPGLLPIMFPPFVPVARKLLHLLNCFIVMHDRDWPTERVSPVCTYGPGAASFNSTFSALNAHVRPGSFSKRWPMAEGCLVCCTWGCSSPIVLEYQTER